MKLSAIAKERIVTGILLVTMTGCMIYSANWSDRVTKEATARIDEATANVDKANAQLVESNRVITQQQETITIYRNLSVRMLNRQLAEQRPLAQLNEDAPEILMRVPNEAIRFRPQRLLIHYAQYAGPTWVIHAKLPPGECLTVGYDIDEKVWYSLPERVKLTHETDTVLMALETPTAAEIAAGPIMYGLR